MLIVAFISVLLCVAAKTSSAIDANESTVEDTRRISDPAFVYHTTHGHQFNDMAAFEKWTEDGMPVFKIGLLAPWIENLGSFSAITSASAVSIAMEKISDDPDFPFVLDLAVRDSACDSKMASGNAAELRVLEHIDVFIGPPCSRAAMFVGELAAIWNVPIISWVATDPVFADKNVFSTMARTLGSFDRLGDFLYVIFRNYDWNRIAIVSSEASLWTSVTRAVSKSCAENNITIVSHRSYNRANRYNIRSILEEVTRMARIVILSVPSSEKRFIMLTAHDMGMTDGDYVFFTVEMLPEDKAHGASWSGHDGRNNEARKAFEAVLHVSLAAISGPQVDLFRRDVAKRMRQPPWNQYLPSGVDIEQLSHGDRYAGFLHDAVYLYAVAINQTLSNGENPRNGSAVAAYFRRQIFRGITGRVYMDDFADRQPEFLIFDLKEDGNFHVISEYVTLDNGSQAYRMLGEPQWPNRKIGRQFAPRDVPVCGFDNDLCPDDNKVLEIIIIIILCSVFISVCVIAGTLVFRHDKKQKNARLLAWKIAWEELEGVTKSSSAPRRGSRAGSSLDSPRTGSLKDGASQLSGSKLSSGFLTDAGYSSGRQTVISGVQRQIFATVANLRGKRVALKTINKEHLQITKTIKNEFNIVKEMTHDNINVFVGAVIDPPNICLVWEYCSKGSLQDILENDDIKLDATFKYSLLMDLANGLEYLHKTKISSHGYLKSTNCVVDNKWVLKITDYGLHTVLSNQDTAKGGQRENEEFLCKQWTAPELLRENFPPPQGTQKGDIYSFAIVMYELVFRTQPYSFEQFTPRDVICRVRNGEAVPFRPVISMPKDVDHKIVDLMTACWDENPGARPALSIIRKNLKNMAGGRINLLDTILSVMESYTQHMEQILEERTRQMLDEKQRTDRLLCRLLPQSVADALKAGKTVMPEHFDMVSVYFSDIVGFTNISADSSPLQIVKFLNDLYSCFDDITSSHDVYKVETIGDAYMIVSGCPIRNGKRHFCEIANCALDLLHSVVEFKIAHRPHQQLRLRIGLHSGSCVAGVVGLTMPRYCLFGSTIMDAARMEASGKPQRIHISREFYQGVTQFNEGYEVELRGDMNVKGKGWLTTYWLNGKEGYKKKLPQHD